MGWGWGAGGAPRLSNMMIRRRHWTGGNQDRTGIRIVYRISYGARPYGTEVSNKGTGTRAQIRLCVSTEARTIRPPGAHHRQGRTAFAIADPGGARPVLQQIGDGLDIVRRQRHGRSCAIIDPNRLIKLSSSYAASSNGRLARSSKRHQVFVILACIVKRAPTTQPPSAAHILQCESPSSARVGRSTVSGSQPPPLACIPAH